MRVKERRQEEVEDIGVRERERERKEGDNIVI